MTVRSFSSASSADALADQRRLHRRAAGRVDRQRDRLGAAHVEGALEQRCHGFDGEPAVAQKAARGDDPRQADDRNDGPATEAVLQPTQHARHCRGGDFRRQAARRGAGSLPPRRCSGRPAGAA